MVKRLLCLLTGLGMAAAQAEPLELLMIAPTDQAMPMAQFQNEVLSGGIIKDLGDAIAQRLGRRARYVNVPGDRVGLVMQQGKADGLCYVLPHWIDGDYDWSRPFIADAELIAARDGAPPLHALTDLRDRPIGTVAAYRYPRVEQVLGNRFVRDDVANIDLNLRRLTAGPLQYGIVGQLTLDYQMRMNKSLKLHPELVFASFKAMCAFTHGAQVPFKDVNRVINALIDDGSVERILARYR